MRDSLCLNPQQSTAQNEDKLGEEAVLTLTVFLVLSLGAIYFETVIYFTYFVLEMKIFTL